MHGTYSTKTLKTLKAMTGGLPVARRRRLFFRAGVLHIITDDQLRLDALAIYDPGHRSFFVTCVGDPMPKLSVLRARWTGPLPAVGEYMVAARRARCAYRIVRDVAQNNVIPPTRGQEEMIELNIWVERVDLPLPKEAVSYPWHWDQQGRRGKNSGYVNV